MKKQYIFIVMIFIMFYMLYLVFSYKYNEYKINTYIDEISNINQDIKNSIDEAKDIIDYKSTLAYRNRLLKEEQGLKNKKEKVMYLTDEKKYKKFTDSNFIENYEKSIVKQQEFENDELKNKTNIQKWIYLLQENHKITN
ncbi:MAG: hypothetical protein PHN31_03000 [Candidatus Gracilibacteria bacterium]|nr:hypothetical protein [Candidatus Gracilibacteria bacterium]